MRRLLSWLKIGPRIYLVIAIMAALTMGIGWMGIFSIDRYETQSNQMSDLAERALISQRVVASLVNTRGITQEIYAVEDGERLKALIAAMNAEIASVEQVMVRWESMLPPETQKTFAENVKKPLQAISSIAVRSSPPCRAMAPRRLAKSAAPRRAEAARRGDRDIAHRIGAQCQGG